MLLRTERVSFKSLLLKFSLINKRQTTTRSKRQHDQEDSIVSGMTFKRPLEYADEYAAQTVKRLTEISQTSMYFSDYYYNVVYIE